MEPLKEFFKELFAHNYNSNRSIVDALAKQSPKESDEIVRLLSHITNVHGIWINRILDRPFEQRPWTLVDRNDIIHIEEQNYHDSLRVLEESDLGSFVEYATFSGKRYTSSIRDVLFQIVSHGSYHRGQIAKEFRRQGTEPILTDWIVSKMQSIL